MESMNILMSKLIRPVARFSDRENSSGSGSSKRCSPSDFHCRCYDRIGWPRLTLLYILIRTFVDVVVVLPRKVDGSPEAVVKIVERAELVPPATEVLACATPPSPRIIIHIFSRPFPSAVLFCKWMWRGTSVTCINTHNSLTNVDYQYLVVWIKPGMICVPAKYSL